MARGLGASVSSTIAVTVASTSRLRSGTLILEPTWTLLFQAAGMK